MFKKIAPVLFGLFLLAAPVQVVALSRKSPVVKSTKNIAAVGMFIGACGALISAIKSIKKGRKGERIPVILEEGGQPVNYLLPVVHYYSAAGALAGAAVLGLLGYGVLKI